MNNNNIYHYRESLTDLVQDNKENINFFNQNEATQVGENLKRDQESNSDMIIYSKDQRSKNGDGFKFIETINKKHVQTSMGLKAFKEGKENQNRHCEDENKPTDTVNKERKVLMELETGSTRDSSVSWNVGLYCNENSYLPLFQTQNAKIPHEYILDIWETLKIEEENNQISFEKINSQKDINERMRAILIDWLVDVHGRFRLREETLFLTVNIIDRYTSLNQILRSQLQLYGVSSLMIACKYEEILCPDISDFVFVTDKTYSKVEIISAEREILLTLGFSITIPTSLRFFEIIALNFNFNEIEWTYGKYVLETFLIDNKMNKYPSSLIALAAAYILMKTNNYPDYKELYNLFNRNPNLQSVSNQKTLKDCAKEMYFLVENIERYEKLQAVYNKFSNSSHFRVSCLGMGSACIKR